MTGTHLAMLRGINVGRAKRVAMADLRALFAGLGYRDVRTLLNSGNVVFSGSAASTQAMASRIEKVIPSKLGLSARVTVLTAAELASVVADNPLLDVAGNHSRLFVSFLADPGDRSQLKPLLARDWGAEAMALGRRVTYVWCPRGMLESPLAATLFRTLGDAVTTRNWSTVVKLHALAAKVS
jgi:uncharacterized protein (DUF1697 family)